MNESAATLQWRYPPQSSVRALKLVIPLAAFCLFWSTVRTLVQVVPPVDHVGSKVDSLGLVPGRLEPTPTLVVANESGTSHIPSISLQTHPSSLLISTKEPLANPIHPSGRAWTPSEKALPTTVTDETTTLNSRTNVHNRIQPNSTATTRTWPYYSSAKHFSLEKSLQVLTYLGDNDKYDGGALRCIKEPYRTPQLYWYDYSNTTIQTTSTSTNNSATVNFQPTRRLLIVQSAGFGTYAQLLELTAPINKAYAHKWGHDILILQGTLVWLKEEQQTQCPPPEHRSTHNKMQILNFALQLNDFYDYLLILDADAMIYDLAKDLSNLMPPTAVLAANKAVPKKGVKKRATWKINAGVTLWNLQHPLTRAVAQGWREAALGYLNGRNNNQGDQLFLYHVLKNNATLEEHVYALSKDFNYNKATVIKHIKRPKVTYEIGQTHLDSRAELIATFQREICETFPMDCQDLDQTPYSLL